MIRSLGLPSATNLSPFGRSWSRHGALSFWAAGVGKPQSSGGGSAPPASTWPGSTPTENAKKEQQKQENSALQN